MTVPTTYATLQTAVSAYGARSGTAFTNLVPDFIRYAQDEMNNDPSFRFKFMESTVDLVIKKSITAETVGGTADAITLTRPTTDTIASYALGQRDAFTAGSTNTGAVTVNIDGAGVVALRKLDGSTSLGPLESGDIVAGHDYEIYYDGTVFRLLPAPGGVPLPSRYAGMRRVYLDASQRKVLEPLPPEYFHSRVFVNTSEEPRGYTIEGQYLILGSVDQAYSAKALYWRGLAAFANASDTDWLIVNRPNIYINKTLSVAFRQLGQPANAAMWEASYAEERDNLRASELRDRFGATPRARSSTNVY